MRFVVAAFDGVFKSITLLEGGCCAEDALRGPGRGVVLPLLLAVTLNTM